MIKIGKKEAIYGYVDIILAQLANIIVLPIVLNRVSTEEYAIWNVFVSIQAFVVLFESGFSIVVARFTTYAYTGAESIPLHGKPEIKEDHINYDLLNEVLYLFEQVEADVIVFEDMDRFNSKVIFERLREVNNLVNVHKYNKFKNKKRH